MKYLLSIAVAAFLATFVLHGSATYLLADEDDDVNRRPLARRVSDDCMPSQFEIEGISTSPVVSVIEHFKWTFDAKNQKQFVTVDIKFPIKTSFNLLYRFDESEPKLYIFPKDKKWCRSRPLRRVRKLDTPCIGKRSTKVDSIIIGSNTKCNVWRKEMKTKRGSSINLRIVENDAVPVYTHVRHGPKGMFQGFVNWFNFNKDVTIRKEKFEVPDVCESHAATSITRDMPMESSDVFRIADVIETLIDFDQ